MQICSLEFYFNLLITFHFHNVYVETKQPLFFDVDNNIDLDENAINAISYAPPLTPPTNFTLTKVIDGQTAEFKWKPLPLETEIGRIRGYKIQMWSDLAENMKEIVFGPTDIKARINSFVPFTTNYVHLYAFTDEVDGPTTAVISFETPESIPGPVAAFDAIPMSTRSIYLKWKRPVKANGILTGYHVYLSKTDTKKKSKANHDSFRTIDDPWITGLKISNLEKDTKYRFTIRALTEVGEGTPFSVEGKTAYKARMPDPPNIIWYPLPDIGGKAAIKVIWMPDDEEHLGDEFFLAYREEGEKQWIQVEPEEVWDEIVVRNLKSLTKYAVRTVVIDGEFARRSNLLMLKTAPTEAEMAMYVSKLGNGKGGTSGNKTSNMLSLKKLIKCLSYQL